MEIVDWMACRAFDEAQITSSNLAGKDSTPAMEDFDHKELL